MTKKEEKAVNKITDEQLSNVTTKQTQINDALHRIGDIRSTERRS